MQTGRSRNLAALLVFCAAVHDCDTARCAFYGSFEDDRVFVYLKQPCPQRPGHGFGWVAHGDV